MFELQIFRGDGDRYENHHCDGPYEFLDSLQRAIAIALDCDDVTSIKIIPPRP